MLRGMRHTGFVVSDLERSLELYRDTLGLREVRRGEIKGEFISKVVNVPDAHLRTAHLQHPDGGHLLELIQYVAPRGKRNEHATQDVGTPHLALELEDLEAILPKLKQKGVSVPGEVLTVSEGERKGAKVAYARDPDGIILELSSPPPGS